MAVYGERKKAKSAKKRLHFTQNCAILFSGSNAPLAQMDRAQASDAWCRRFESAMVRQRRPAPKGRSSLRIMAWREPSAFREAVCGTSGDNTYPSVTSPPPAAKSGSKSAMVRQKPLAH